MALALFSGHWPRSFTRPRELNLPIHGKTLPIVETGVAKTTRIHNKKGTSKMQITSTNRVVVEPGGAGVVAHVGLHALGAFADRLGLSHLLSSRIAPRGERLPVHDRGKVLTQMALVIAGGGESCADIEHLRLQSDLFGHVASDSTVYRTFHELDGAALAELAKATAAVRAKVWDQFALTSGTGPVYLDIDASLIEVHSENKVGAAPNYKKGYGFHPMLCFADATGEALSAVLAGQRRRQHRQRPRQCARRRD